VPTLKVYGDASGRQSGPESVVRHMFVQDTWQVFVSSWGHTAESSSGRM
jgi:hypothetical protein